MSILQMGAYDGQGGRVSIRKGWAIIKFYCGWTETLLVFWMRRLLWTETPNRIEDDKYE